MQVKVFCRKIIDFKPHDDLNMTRMTDHPLSTPVTITFLKTGLFSGRKAGNHDGT